jgi:hypothetical protein
MESDEGRQPSGGVSATPERDLTSKEHETFGI